MDIGIIASRYAKALYKYAEEQKAERSVYDSLVYLMQLFKHLPKLQALVASPELSVDDKLQLIKAALEQKSHAALILDFLALVLRNQRASFLIYICYSYLLLYRQRNKLTSATLTSASHVSETQLTRFKALVAKHTGSEVELTTTVDETLAGGFVLEFDGYRIDASLRTQLETIKRQLVNATM